jgi:hypothetical protein
MLEPAEKELGELLETARPAPPLSEGWEERAAGRMAKAGPRRACLWGRRLVLAAAAGAAVVLGVCFIPRSDHAARDFGAAVAALQEASTLHMAGWARRDGIVYHFDQWQSRDGFYRCDLSAGGEVKEVWMKDGAVQLRPNGAAASPFDQRGSPGDTRFPESIHIAHLAGHAVFGEPTNVFPDDLAPRITSGESLEQSLREWGSGAEKYFDATVTEKAEQTSEGERKVLVVNVHGSTYFTVNDDRTITPGPGQETYRMRMAIDPTTERPTWIGEDSLEAGEWLPVYRVEQIRWNVAIPGSVLDFPSPPGHRRVQNHWWERLNELLATASSQDWEVTLNAVDVNEEGDLFVTFSRTPKSGAPEWEFANSRLAVGVAAADNTGAAYTNGPQPSGEFEGWAHWEGFQGVVVGTVGKASARVRLYRPEGATGRAHTVTIMLTLDSPPRERSKQQVIFRSVPLPPRQPGDDLWAEAMEVTDY